MAILFAFASCEDDDDGLTVTFEERDRAEQQIVDDSTLVAYLSSHYYNSSFFETGTNHKYTDIVITELEEGEVVPEGHTLLFDAVDSPFSTTTFLDTDYKYYVLRINQGGGDAPNFTDQVRVKYEGSSVNTGEVFDSRITPFDIPLVGNGFTTFGTIKGWQLVLPSFNSALDFSPNNGNIDYNNFGLGVMFLPSGLSYFSGITTGTAYDNLIFKFELLQFQQEDHDNDGVPSYLEDLDGDEDVNNDDTNGDGFPNYIDNDDDDDGVLTINEDLDNDGDPTNDDSDGDGIPNYLDADSTDSNETDE
mgnify:CR=1 FL=1